jgi:hypothetical protein
MPTRLLTLRDVTVEEVEEIREFLEANGVDFYETPASNWGISAGAIWIGDGGPVEKARSLLDGYERDRARRTREAFEQLEREGRNETLLGRLRHHPVRSLFYLAVIALVLYLSTFPFLGFVG